MINCYNIYKHAAQRYFFCKRRLVYAKHKRGYLYASGRFRDKLSFKERLKDCRANDAGRGDGSETRR